MIIFTSKITNILKITDKIKITNILKITYK